MGGAYLAAGELLVLKDVGAEKIFGARIGETLSRTKQILVGLLGQNILSTISYCQGGLNVLVGGVNDVVPHL